MTLQQLDDIREKLAIAASLEDVAGATLQLVERLRDDVERRTAADPALLQLVREAFDAFNDPESKVDLRAWTQEAKRWL